MHFVKKTHANPESKRQKVKIDILGRKLKRALNFRQELHVEKKIIGSSKKAGSSPVFNIFGNFKNKH